MIATHKGAIAGRRAADELTVDRSFHTASSAEADAVVVAGGAGLATNPAVHHLRAERLPPPQADRARGATAPSCSPPPASGSTDPGVVTTERATKTFAKSVARAPWRSTGTGSAPAPTPPAARHSQEA